MQDDYYDILSDVYKQPSDKSEFQRFMLIPSDDDIDTPDTPLWTHGLIENCSLDDGLSCAQYLTDRDNVITSITGVFDRDPYNFKFALIRRAAGIFHEYTLTHFGLLYHTLSFRTDGRDYINPRSIIQEAVDMEGYKTFTIPVSGYGMVSIPVHILVGMTFWPHYYRSSVQTFCHRNGDKNDNHIQNIGGIHV